MTPDKIIDKWIGREFSGDPVIRDVEIRITAGMRADIQQAITAAVEEEREECAQIAEDAGPVLWHKVANETGEFIAHKIRERRNKSDGGTK